MKIIFYITAATIILYFLYPVWLKLMAIGKRKAQPAKGKIDRVTLILLTYNGKPYLEDKINLLLQDLRAFPEHEMLIIDDHSTDGSQELLHKYASIPGIRVILKEEQRGIPHTMNMAVSMALFENIIFCDQRQVTSLNSLVKLVEMLADDETGAVSACISHIDKAGCSSWIRRYENYLKEAESRAGSLMGVYGPLYALKRSCYHPLPEHIILDDLYLSLKVMTTRKINITQECLIFDDHICSLHDYKRIRRYIKGFQQILADKELMMRLPSRQLVMLIWHKYVRLLIPVFLCLSYFATGILSFFNPWFIVVFSILTLVGIASLTPFFYNLHNIIIHFVRINILYVIATAQVLLKVEH